MQAPINDDADEHRRLHSHSNEQQPGLLSRARQEQRQQRSKSYGQSSAPTAARPRRRLRQSRSDKARIQEALKEQFRIKTSSISDRCFCRNDCRHHAIFSVIDTAGACVCVCGCVCFCFSVFLCPPTHMRARTYTPLTQLPLLSLLPNNWGRVADNANLVQIKRHPCCSCEAFASEV